MKRKGFTLIELVVVIALIAILAVTLAPRLRDQIAKAGDAKAIAVLGSLRTASEVYFADNQKTVTAVMGTGNEIVELKKSLDNSAQNLFDEADTADVYVPIGGSRVNSGDDVVYGGEVTFTFGEDGDPAASEDGISLWFNKDANNGASTVVTATQDTKNNPWASY